MTTYQLEQLTDELLESMKGKPVAVDFRYGVKVDRRIAKLLDVDQDRVYLGRAHIPQRARELGMWQRLWYGITVKPRGAILHVVDLETMSEYAVVRKP